MAAAFAVPATHGEFRPISRDGRHPTTGARFHVPSLPPPGLSVCKPFGLNMRRVASVLGRAVVPNEEALALEEDLFDISAGVRSGKPEIRWSGGALKRCCDCRNAVGSASCVLEERSSDVAIDDIGIECCSVKHIPKLTCLVRH